MGYGLFWKKLCEVEVFLEASPQPPPKEGEKERPKIENRRKAEEERHKTKRNKRQDEKRNITNNTNFSPLEKGEGVKSPIKVIG